MTGLESGRRNIGQLFDRTSFYNIPDYQRPFSWTADNLTDLFDDLTSAPDESEYFLGTLVLHETDKSGDVITYDVVDGQQRITSLCLLLACIRDSSAFAENEEGRNEIQDKLLQKKQALASIPQKSRLHVRDVTAFDKVVLKPGGTAPGTASEIPSGDERRYRAAAAVLRDRLAELTTDRIEQLAMFILQRCVVVYLAAPSFEDAFRLFTVVNDRGQQLRRIDILKARNLAPSVVMQPELRSHYADKWEAMEERVGAATFEEIFHSLRLIYTMDKPKFDLLREYEHRILGQPGRPALGVEFLDRLQEYVELYDSLFITRDYLEDSGDSARFETMISAMIASFNASEWRAVVLRFAHKYGRSRVYELVLAVEKVFLQHWVQGVRKDERYSTYTDILHAIDVSDSEQAVLDSISYDLDPIRQACKARNFYGTGYAKYLLLRAEILASELTEPRLFTVRSIEHVLPQNPVPDGPWFDMFTQDEIDELVHTAGNLVLLSKAKNSAAQNREFKAKKRTYLSPRVTDFPRSVQVLAIETWNRETIEARTREFADSVLRDPRG